MTVMQQTGNVARPGGLYDVLDLILDKGLVIDVFVRVSLVGIELITIDIRIVVASVDTYLRFAEACNRLDLGSSGGEKLPDLVEGTVEKGSEGKTKGALRGVTEAIAEPFKSDDSDKEKETEKSEKKEGRTSSKPRRRSSSKESE